MMIGMISMEEKKDKPTILSLLICILIVLVLLLKEVNIMLDFIQNNSELCIVVVIIVIALIEYIYRYRKDILKKAALYAVALAEKAWGSKTGQIKFSEAYTYLKKNYPFITFFLSEKQLSTIIEDALVNLEQIIAAKEGLEKSEEKEEKTVVNDTNKKDEA